MDVVDQIAAMPNSGEPENAALDPVVMESVTIQAPSSPSPAAPPATPVATTPVASDPAPARAHRLDPLSGNRSRRAATLRKVNRRHRMGG